MSRNWPAGVSSVKSTHEDEFISLSKWNDIARKINALANLKITRGGSDKVDYGTDSVTLQLKRNENV